MIKITLDMVKVSHRFIELINIAGTDEINFIISDIGVFIFVQGCPLHLFIHELPPKLLPKNTTIVLYGTPDIFNNYKFLLKLGSIDAWFDGSYFYFTELIKVKASHLKTLPRHETQWFKLLNPNNRLLISSHKNKISLSTEARTLHSWMSKIHLRDFNSEIETDFIPYFINFRIVQTKARTYMMNPTKDYISLSKI